jgi:hypothetical protein
MAQDRPIDTGTFVYFYRYRKLLTVLGVLCLLGLPYKIYSGPPFDQAHKYEDIGYALDTLLMFVACPIWMLINVRRAVRAYSNEEEWKKM